MRDGKPPEKRGAKVTSCIGDETVPAYTLRLFHRMRWTKNLAKQLHLFQYKSRVIHHKKSPKFFNLGLEVVRFCKDWDEEETVGELLAANDLLCHWLLSRWLFSNHFFSGNFHGRLFSHWTGGSRAFFLRHQGANGVG
jgi:hypothetical protein